MNSSRGLRRVLCAALSVIPCASAPARDLQRLPAGTVFATARLPVVVVSPGRFSMGSPAGEAGRFDDEGPQHPVAVRRAFAAGRYEVTRKQFATFAQATGHSAEGCHEWNGSHWERDLSKNWRNPGFSQAMRQF